MHTTNEFLNALKAKTGAGSDYALAKFLGVRPSCISNYRNGRSQFDDAMALKAASILEIDPGIIAAACHAERANTEAEKTLWKSVFERLGGIAAALTIGIMLSAPSPAEASNAKGYSSVHNASDLYIMRIKV